MERIFGATFIIFQTCVQIKIINARIFSGDQCDLGWKAHNGNGCEKYGQSKWCKTDGDHYGSGWKEKWENFEKWADDKGRTALVCPQCGCEEGIYDHNFNLISQNFKLTSHNFKLTSHNFKLTCHDFNNIILTFTTSN